MIQPEALLESWMRQYYFETSIDIGSSGVQSFSLAELRQLVGISQDEIDQITFDDSRTLGAPDLRLAIARQWGNGDPECVMATHGSSEAIYLILNALLREHDEVVILDPIYQQFFSIAEAVGCSLKTWRLRFEQQFAPRVEEARALITSRTRMVIVNFPHNPTGASLTLDEQERLIEAVAEVGAYLVWDAAFAQLTYEQPPLPDPTLKYDRAISIGTLSKAYGLPGLRVGWCLASPDVLARCIHLRDYITLHLSPLVELIAQRAIEKADVLLKIRREQAAANQEILTNWLEQQEGLVEGRPLVGGVCAFLRLPAVPDVEVFCHQMARRFGVLLVPGTCFNHPHHVRLGFGGPTAELQEGLSRLSTLLRSSVNV